MVTSNTNIKASFFLEAAGNPYWLHLLDIKIFYLICKLLVKYDCWQLVVVFEEVVSFIFQAEELGRYFLPNWSIFLSDECPVATIYRFTYKTNMKQSSVGRFWIPTSTKDVNHWTALCKSVNWLWNLTFSVGNWWLLFKRWYLFSRRQKS